VRLADLVADLPLRWRSIQLINLKVLKQKPARLIGRPPDPDLEELPGRAPARQYRAVSRLILFPDG
jgi:hypothetical protein